MELIVDVVVIGDGISGLSAALYCARGLLSIVVVSDGRHRNSMVQHSHSFVTRDNATPEELVRVGREQLIPYGVQFRDGCSVLSVKKKEEKGGAFFFEVVLSSGGDVILCRRIIFACGVEDHHTDRVVGLQELWGSLVHHCPFCFGLEIRNRPVAIMAQNSAPMMWHLVEKLPHWASQVTVFLNGEKKKEEWFSGEQLQLMERNQIAVVEETISSVARSSQNKDEIEIFLAGGKSFVFSALYTMPSESRVRCADILNSLGCQQSQDGKNFVLTNPTQETSVKGVYLCGDATGMFPPNQLVSGAYTGFLAGAFCVSSIADQHFKAATPKHGKN